MESISTVKKEHLRETGQVQCLQIHYPQLKGKSKKHKKEIKSRTKYHLTK